MAEWTVDLYGILGLRQTDQPTHEQIRKAYRKLAKTAHPDHRGDPAVFERISLAHDVLTDDARRARYDATGEYDEGTSDNAHVELYANLALLLDEVAQGIVKAGRDIDTVDYPHEMRVTVRQQIKNLADSKRKLDRDIPKLRRAAKRFRRRGTADDPLSTIFAERVDKLEKFADEVAKAHVIAKQLLEFLKDYDFDLSDVMQQASPQCGTLFIGGFGWSATTT